LSDGPKATALGKIVIFAIIIASAYGAYRMWLKSKVGTSGGSDAAAVSSTGSPGSLASSGDVAEAEIGIAYGTEKDQWLKWAVLEFAKTEAGKKIKVNLIPVGSQEGAQRLVAGDQKIHIWAPASSIYKEIFVQDWQVKYSNQPILKEESIALSPMVFVMWKERYDAYMQKYGALNFATVEQALREKTGWQGIAGKGEWGLFKLGHTLPNESNSGLITLILMAYDFHQKNKGLTAKDIIDYTFQARLANVEGAVSLSKSTGTMMREMVLKGPSTYDALFLYESVAIDYLKNAEGRWGELHIAYPTRNMWNDNPYYIIDATWSSPAQRKAAEVFLDFLLSEPVQKQSLQHGFRPANPAVPVKFANSPFVLYEKFGLRNDIGQICDPPSSDVITNLLASWQRSQSH